MLDGSLKFTRVVAKGEVLYSEQDPHQELTEQSRRHAGEGDHQPKHRRERGIAVAGDVRLLSGTSPGGNPPFDQRLWDS